MFVFTFVYASLPIYKSEQALKAQARQLLQNQPVQFIENKGQMANLDGKPVPFVLFKAQSPEMDMYITEKGLSYVFKKLHKEEIKEDKKTERDKAEEQATGKKKKNKWMSWERIDMFLSGATIKKENVTQEGISPDFFQYFYPHCPNGITDVRSFEKITIKDIYPGIDWVLYSSAPADLLGRSALSPYGGAGGGFKYDFIVHPGADPNQIELIYSSLNPLQIDNEGNIQITTELGTLTENAPYSYIKENKEEVATQFQITNQQHITQDNLEYYQTRVNFKFQISNFKSKTLVIDPQLYWSTFYGANGDEGPMSIDTDHSGNVYVTGYLNSMNFPKQDPGSGSYFQGAFGGGDWEAFILKFDNAGKRLWCTFYGGSESDSGNSVTTDDNGNVFVTGYTASTDFPLQDAGTFFQGNYGGGLWDSFILKFDNAGNRLWATLYGDFGADLAASIAADVNGNVFITGWTDSTAFPLQDAGGFFQNASGGGLDAFILKFDNNGNRIWSTFYGGSDNDWGFSIIADVSGNIFITGASASGDFPLQDAGTFFQGSYGGGSHDSFILKFSNTGNRLWSTLYGGSQLELGCALAGDDNGNVFIAGMGNSPDFPLQDAGTFFQGTKGGKADAFILKFDNAGNRLWASWYGGSEDEIFRSAYDNLAVDACGNVYLSFEIFSPGGNLLTKPSCEGGYYDSTYNGGPTDIFIVHFTNTGALLWATYLGGSGADLRPQLAVDHAGSLFVTGEWTFILGNSGNATYPLTNPGGGAYYDGTFNGGTDDGFMVKFVTPGLTLNASAIAADCNCTGIATAITTGGCSPYQYAWYDSNWTRIGDTSALDKLCAGEYAVIVKDTSYCIIKTDTAYAAIAGGSPALYASQTNNCDADGKGTAVVVGAGGSPPYTYSWSPGGGTNSSATDLNTNTTYTITVTDAKGCSESAVVNIMAKPGPVVEVNANVNINAGESVVLTASGGGTYEWSPADGLSCTTCPNPTASPGASITYTITITDANGCKAMATVMVTVDDCAELFVPNVFSPNGDGINDLFKIDCLKPEDQVKIFNRWGMQVFTFYGKNNGWDGRKENAETCVEGVYYYIIILNNELKENISGVIHLLR